MSQPPPRSTLFPYTTLFRSKPSKKRGGKTSVLFPACCRYTLPKKAPSLGFRPKNCAKCWQPVHGRRSEEHTSELQSRPHLVCRLLLEKKKKKNQHSNREDTR